MVYQCQIRVGMASVDAAGRIFYPELFRLAHECVESFLMHVDLHLPDWLSDGTWLLPVVHAEADYLHPIGLGDVLQVQLRVVSLGRTSLTFECEFLGTEAETLARTRTVHVCVDRKTGRSAPLPDSVRERLVPWS